MCHELIVSCTEIDDNYFKDLNRGGLTVPSLVTLTIGRQAYGIMQFLVSEEYEKLFLASSQQHLLLTTLILKGLRRNEVTASFCIDVCVCGQCFEDLFKEIVKILSNLMLNNYRKIKSESCETQAMGKRKLSTLL